MAFLKKHLERSAYVPYFAYNQLADPGQFAKLGIFCKGAVPVRLPEHRLVFNVLEDVYFRFEKRGVANIIPSGADYVEGVLYQVHAESLNLLDQYAGVMDFKYYRKLVKVISQEGRKMQALTYAAWPDVTSEGLLPSRHYINQLVSAADRFQFSESFKLWLQQHPTTR
ncbi:MAG: gamma-glutamylcyclotransferase family protein [bacterium]